MCVVKSGQSSKVSGKNKNLFIFQSVTSFVAAVAHCLNLRVTFSLGILTKSCVSVKVLGCFKAIK